jgi:DNA-binding XRE family transcriptional regulator
VARHEIPWDFARHYCDPAYRPRVEAVAERGRLSLGERVREMRTAAGMTQYQLAFAAGIGRVTLVRLESGEQSPRYETLVAIARALGRPVGELVAAA